MMKLKTGDTAYYQNRECKILSLYENQAVVRIYAAAYYEHESGYNSSSYEEHEPIDLAVCQSRLTAKVIDITEKEQEKLSSLKKDSEAIQKTIRDWNKSIDGLRKERDSLDKSIEDDKQSFEIINFVLGRSKKFVLYKKSSYGSMDYDCKEMDIVRLKGSVPYELKLYSSGRSIKICYEGLDLILGDTKEEVLAGFGDKLRSRTDKGINWIEYDFCKANGLTEFTDIYDSNKKKIEDEIRQKEIEKAKATLEKLEKASEK